MRILAVGGGSGGHVTPVAAVLRELKQTHPQADIRFWCDAKFAPQAKSIMSHLDGHVPVQVIAAGKLRRYHHVSVLRQLMWPSVVLRNLGDSFLIFAGVFQSLIKLIIWRPNVVFTKGGYVCLPVGFAAHLLRIPLVIHDSDAHPGLTNRILSRWAQAIATGAPLKYYSYPAERSHYVGIPITTDFTPFSESQQRAAKEQWGFVGDRPLIVVTGGGLGAKRINDTVVGTLDDLLGLGSVALISGTLQYEELRTLVPENDNKFQLLAFVSHDMAALLGAADVVVTRAGATTILELAALAKPTILVPNAKLTGGHQLKNAVVYEDAHAAIIVNEDVMREDPQVLVEAVRRVLSNPEEAKEMAMSLASFARPHAARDVADMVIAQAK